MKIAVLTSGLAVATSAFQAPRPLAYRPHSLWLQQASTTPVRRHVAWRPCKRPCSCQALHMGAVHVPVTAASTMPAFGEVALGVLGHVVPAAQQALGYVWLGLRALLAAMTPSPLEVQLSLRLLLAAFVGLSIGMERRTSHRPAGVRTMSLVAMGAATFTMVSLNGFQRADQARVAASVASGVGFIGAGVITTSSNRAAQSMGKNANDVDGDIRGLTTASAIWITSALGMAAGAGMCFTALYGTAITVLVLKIGRVQKTLAHQWQALENRFGVLRALEAAMGVKKGKREEEEEEEEEEGDHSEHDTTDMEGEDESSDVKGGEEEEEAAEEDDKEEEESKVAADVAAAKAASTKKAEAKAEAARREKRALEVAKEAAAAASRRAEIEAEERKRRLQRAAAEEQEAKKERVWHDEEEEEERVKVRMQTAMGGHRLRSPTPVGRTISPPVWDPVEEEEEVLAELEGEEEEEEDEEEEVDDYVGRGGATTPALQGQRMVPTYGHLDGFWMLRPVPSRTGTGTPLGVAPPPVVPVAPPETVGARAAAAAVAAAGPAAWGPGGIPPPVLGPPSWRKPLAWGDKWAPREVEEEEEDEWGDKWVRSEVEEAVPVEAEEGDGGGLGSGGQSGEHEHGGASWDSAAATAAADELGGVQVGGKTEGEASVSVAAVSPSLSRTEPPRDTGGDASSDSPGPGSVYARPKEVVVASSAKHHDR